MALNPSKEIPEQPLVRNVVIEGEEDIAAFEQWLRDTGRDWSAPMHYEPNPVAVRRLYPPAGALPTLRSREEILDQLRAVRRQLRRGYGPVRSQLLAQEHTLCWVLGASQEELTNRKFLGGSLNVEF